MFVFRIVFILFFIIFISHGLSRVNAQEAKTLTLDRAIETALQNNPSYQHEMSKRDIYDAKILTAGQLQNPKLVSDSGIAEKTYRIGVEQTVEIGKIGQRKKVAKAKAEVQQETLKTAKLKLVKKVRDAYAGLYYAQEFYKTIQQLLENGEKLTDVAKKREEYGDISHLEVLQADIEYSNNENLLHQANYKLKESSQVLGYLMDTSVDTKIPVDAPNQTLYIAESPNVILPNGNHTKNKEEQYLLDQLLTLAKQNNPDYKKLEITEKLHTQKLKLAQRERIPNITIGTGANIITSSDSKTSVYITGELELPLLNREEGPITEAKATLKSFELEKTITEKKIVQEIEQAFYKYQLYRNQLTHYESKILKKSEDYLNKANLSYELGKTNVTIPIKAQENFMKVKLDYLDILLSYQKSIAELEKVTGTRL